MHNGIKTKDTMKEFKKALIVDDVLYKMKFIETASFIFLKHLLNCITNEVSKNNWVVYRLLVR